MNQFTASLWGDEAFSAILSQKSVSGIISTIIRDTSPPLYNLTEHFWFTIFGSSEVAIRALSFLYFSIAIFFVYKIGEHFWNKKTGLIAASLTFLNPFFFIYAFEGRMYSILAATVAASFYFFITKKWVGYVIAASLALYSHHFAIFAVFVQGLWFIKEFIFGKRKTAIPMFKSFLAIGILYSPWLIPLYKQIRMVQGGFWLGKPTLIDLRNLIYKYLTEGISHKLSHISLYLALTLMILRDWIKDKEKSLFLLAWFLIPILATWLISQKFTSIFFDRYLLYTIPAAMLIIVSNTRKVSSFFLVPLAIFFLIIDVFYFIHPTKIPFRDLASFVKNTRTEGSFLINVDAGNHKLWESKYYGIPAPIYNPSGESLPFFVGTALMEKGDVITAFPKDIKVLGIIGNIPEGFKIDDFLIVEEKDFAGLKFSWHRKVK